MTTDFKSVLSPTKRAEPPRVYVKRPKIIKKKKSKVMKIKKKLTVPKGPKLTQREKNIESKFKDVDWSKALDMIDTTGENTTENVSMEYDVDTENSSEQINHRPKNKSATAKHVYLPTLASLVVATNRMKQN